MLLARDILTHAGVWISPAASVRSAIERMLAANTSGLPVVDDSGRLAGIVTEFALLALAYDPAVIDEPVSQHMTSDVLTVDADDPLRKIADLLLVHRVRLAPVVEAGRLLGIVGRREVLTAVYRSQPQNDADLVAAAS